VPAARVALLALVAVAAACGPRAGTGTPAELSLSRAASRGVLSYAVAFARAPEPLLVSVELGDSFELVARKIEPGGALVERARVLLGPPDWDVPDLALVPGRRAALVASAAGTVRAVDLDAGRVTAAWHLGASATAVAVSPDGRLAATGSANGVVCLRRLSDGALLQCLVAHRARVSGLDFDPAGRLLASSSWDGRVAVWSLPQLAAAAELDTQGSANQLAFSPDGGRIAIAVSGAPPRRTPQVEAREQEAGDGDRPPDPGARVLVWRPGFRSGAGPEAGRGAAPLPRRGRLVVELRGHAGPVTAVAWSADARRLLSTSWDRTVRLWEPQSGRELARLSGFSHLLRDLAVAGSGGWAAASAWAAGGEDPATVLLALRHPP
jgi:WD40 repeat protein